MHGWTTMFCQGCGAKNADGARFCNMCGARIAGAGEPGGPVAPSAEGETSSSLPSVPEGAWAEGPASDRAATEGMPSMGASDTGVTLARIGVRSPGKVWSVLALLGVGLVGAGALSTWLVTRGDGEGPAEGGHARADDPFVIGTPLPKGAETPDEDFLADKPEGVGTPVSERRAAARDAPGAQADRGATATPSRARGATGTRAAPARPGPSDRGAPSPTDEATGSRSERASKEDDPGAGEPPEPRAEEAPVDRDGPEDGDIAMDLYGARVRYAVQRYYGARAQSCFDRATRNDPTLSGTVVVGLHIGADGRVTEGSVARNTTGDAELGSCLAGQVRGWRLPPPPEGAVNMEMPFSR